MGILLRLKFQVVPFFSSLLVLGLCLFPCQNSWASQDALVMVERAVIYADESMSAPIGYIKKGKRIKVGDIPRNKAQVYPIIVSGRVAYIKVLDVSTEKESVESDRLVAERFQKVTTQKFKSYVSASGLIFSSQIGLDAQNDQLADKDAFTWTGISLRGGVMTSSRWEFEFLINYLTGEEGDEGFRAVEIGMGGALRIFEKSRFIARIHAELLAIPYASYSLGELFRINGSGYSTGAGVSVSYQFTEHWGLSAYGGLHYMKLMSFEPPSPYKAIEPSFVGNRLGIGANYLF